MDTVGKLIELSVEFVRIYPVIVVKDTPLHEMYLRGDYEPWSLKDMLALLGDVMDEFEASAIPVIKVGLHPTEELRKSVVAGPFHPSIRQLI